MLSRKFPLVPRVWGAGAACDCGAGAEKHIEGRRRLLVRLQRMKCFETPLIFDGGLGTHLESRGNDISGQLWSAQILRENPAEIQAAHEDFYRAGAQVATTASYQVTFDVLGDGKGRRQVQGGTRKLHPRAGLLKRLTNFLSKLLNNPLR